MNAAGTEPMGAPRRPAMSFSASLVRVVDGDTAILDLIVPSTVEIPAAASVLGFTVRAELLLTFTLHCRLRGYNSREAKDAGGAAAATRLGQLLAGPIMVSDIELDKYGGRINAIVTTADGRRVDAVMIAEGLGAWWDGRGQKPLPSWPIPPGAP